MGLCRGSSGRMFYRADRMDAGTTVDRFIGPCYGESFYGPKSWASAVPGGRFIGPPCWATRPWPPRVTPLTGYSMKH